MRSVTACIVSYNNGRLVEQAVRCLLKNKCRPKIYIVDNASADDTVDYIKLKFPQTDYPEVVLIENQLNSGFGAGQNTVLERLSSDYHIIANPDIFVPENAVDNMVDFMENHSDVSLLSARVLYPNGKEQILPKACPTVRGLISRRFPFLNKSRRKFEMRDRDLTVQQEIEFATGCFMFLRTQLFKKVGGFDTRYFMYFEDADLSRRLSAYGKILYNPDFVIHHIWKRSNLKNIRFIFIQFISMIRYFNKWGWRF